MQNVAFTRNLPAEFMPAGTEMPHASNAGVFPRFYYRAMKGADGSYRDVEFVTFEIPGDRFTKPDAKVTDNIRLQYATEYNAFKQREKSRPTGTPLDVWGQVSPAQAATLSHVHGVWTVEQLAELSDVACQNIGFGTDELRKRAKEFMAQRVDASKIVAENASLAKANEDMAARLAKLEAQLSGGEPRRGPGRPPKVDAA